MSDEIQLVGYPSGATLYAIVRNPAGQVWYPFGEAFEDWGGGVSRTANDYSIPMTDKKGSFYVADFPSDIDAADEPYPIQIHLQGSSAPVDNEPVVGEQGIIWTGTSVAVAAVAELGATEICNMALARIGGGDEEESIVSIGQVSKTAAWCRRFYSHCRDYVLKRANFHEASSYGDLGAALTGSSIPEAAEWEYVFNLPSDYVAMMKQTSEDDHEQAYNYRISQGKLFTNDLTNSDEDSAYIEYIARNVDASTYGPTLVEAIVVFLASKLAGPIAKNDQWGQSLLQEFETVALPNAKARNQADVADPGEKGETSWLNARG